MNPEERPMESNSNHEDRVGLFMQRLAESTPHERARMPSASFIWLRAQWAREAEERGRADRVRWILETLLTLAAAAAGLAWGLNRVFGPAGSTSVSVPWENLVPSLGPLGLVLVAATLSLVLTLGAGRAVWALARR